jgi:hypothetical protein
LCLGVGKIKGLRSEGGVRFIFSFSSIAPPLRLWQSLIALEASGAANRSPRAGYY